VLLREGGRKPPLTPPKDRKEYRKSKAGDVSKLLSEKNKGEKTNHKTAKAQTYLESGLL